MKNLPFLQKPLNQDFKFSCWRKISPQKRRWKLSFGRGVYHYLISMPATSHIPPSHHCMVAGSPQAALFSWRRSSSQCFILQARISTNFVRVSFCNANLFCRPFVPSAVRSFQCPCRRRTDTRWSLGAGARGSCAHGKSDWS